MKIYWSLKDVPELRDLTPAERYRVHRACLRHQPNFYRDWRVLLRNVIVVGLFALAGWQANFFFGIDDSPYAVLIGAAIGGSITGFMWHQRTFEHLRPYYAEYIKNELHRDLTPPSRRGVRIAVGLVVGLGFFRLAMVVTGNSSGWFAWCAPFAYWSIAYLAWKQELKGKDDDA